MQTPPRRRRARGEGQERAHRAPIGGSERRGGEGPRLGEQERESEEQREREGDSYRRGEGLAEPERDRSAGVWARERPAGGDEGPGCVQRGPLVGWRERGGVRELGESAGASRQRLGQLATGALRRRAGSELRQRHVEDVQKQ